MNKEYKPTKIEIWIENAPESIEETLKSFTEMIEMVEEKYPGLKLGHSAENADMKNIIKEKIINLLLKEWEVLTEVQKKLEPQSHTKEYCQLSNQKMEILQFICNLSEKE